MVIDPKIPKLSQDTDIGSKTRSSLIWNTSLKIIYEVFRFSISIIIARILDPKDFGIMGMASMIVFYANSMTNFGFNLALIQRKEINKDHVNSVFTIDIAISFIFTVVVVLLSTPIASFFRTPELTNVLLVLSLVFILTSLYKMPQTLMKKNVKYID